jgi:hypothetical protein
MELASLIVEFTKALAWPIVVVFLVVRFRSGLQDLLLQFGGRVRSAESVKLKILDQEIELSGTAKELIREREELLQDRTSGTAALKKAERIRRYLDRLANPMSDAIGLALLENEPDGARIEELVRDVWKMLSPEMAIKKQPPVPIAVLAMHREIETTLAQFAALGLVSVVRETYQLTAAGRDLFNKVRANQDRLLARFDQAWNR